MGYNLKSMQLLADKMDKFLPGIEIFEELAGKSRRGGNRMLLLNTAHHHAEMLRFDHNCNPKRFECLLDTIADLNR